MNHAPTPTPFSPRSTRSRQSKCSTPSTTPSPSPTSCSIPQTPLVSPSYENLRFSDLLNQIHFRNSRRHSKRSNHDLRLHAYPLCILPSLSDHAHVPPTPFPTTPPQHIPLPPCFICFLPHYPFRLPLDTYVTLSQQPPSLDCFPPETVIQSPVDPPFPFANPHLNLRAYLQNPVLPLTTFTLVNPYPVTLVYVPPPLFAPFNAIVS